jgi:hypothetical protein
VKGRLRINALTTMMFLTYLIALALISLDDISTVLHVPITLTKDYWISIEWFYPVYSSVAFFMFGRVSQAQKPTNSANPRNGTREPS